MNEPRPWYWSVRREIWENRIIYLAPIIVAAVVLFATLISTLTLPKKLRTADASKARASIVRPFTLAPAPIMLATIAIGMMYCADALYGERRDRSILFWKSLPVSDRTTVIAKASVPLVVLPAIGYALSVIVQIVLLFASTVILLANGISPAPVWTEFKFFPGLILMFYGLAVHALWYAPIYGWLLMVSAWARRAAVLWALLPWFALAAVERIAGTTFIIGMIEYRAMGAMREAFSPKNPEDANRFSQLDPVKFLTAPGLWVGLFFAAVFLVQAARLRRNREPI